MPRRVFRIWNKKDKRYEGVYSRAYHDEYDFSSEESARSSNVHNIYQDKDKYDIHEFEITEKRVR